jgi:hypothetical protein
LKENYFSAGATVANLASPTFDGFIEYDTIDDGNPVNFTGVSVFAPGLRNPFGIMLHSNGFLYGTDNGPNTGYGTFLPYVETFIAYVRSAFQSLIHFLLAVDNYINTYIITGKMKIGCSPSDLLADQQREDKLVHIMRNKYYGHPNPKRATHDNDPRQCVWRNPTEPTSTNYEAPIGVVLSSATGIIEYKADHFNRQLRNNIIFVKYKSGLRRTVLSPNGLTANPLSLPGITLFGTSGLDVTQAPNGNLLEIRYVTNTIYVGRPNEAATAILKVSSIFPWRGGVAGGTLLRIYGYNFGTTPTIKVGTTNCPVIVGTMSATYLECTLPGGPAGLVDVIVTSNTGTYTFQKGYRYITGTGFS